MEQNFLFIHKKYQEIFNVITDEIDETKFNNLTFDIIKNIIRTKKLNGKFTLINIYNGITKKFRTHTLTNNKDNEMMGGSYKLTKKKEFMNSWNNINNYINSNINSNIDNNVVKILYNNFLVSANNYGIHKDEANNMVYNLINNS